MDPGAGYRFTPPLLPSSALKGLEQFVPPDRPTHASLTPSWKFKPLPELPKRTPTSYNTQDGGKILIPRRDAPVGVHNNGDDYSNLKLKQAADLRQFLDENFRHLKASRSCEDLPNHPNSVSSSPISRIPRRPTSSLYTKSTSQTERESIIHQSPREILVRRPSLTTVNSMHPSLMPAPLVIDGLRICTDVPPLPTLESIDFCHCHLPHPEHFSTGPGLESPHSYYRGSSAWCPASSEYSDYQDTDPGRESSELLGRQSLDSQYPNRTRLYSFSVISRKDTYSDTDSDDGNVQVFIQNEEELSRLTNNAAPPTPTDSSHGNDRRTTYSPFPSTRPYVERPRQLAIPPTDYQKYGAKVFADEQKKQNRTALLPKCMRKLFPWSWREEVEEVEREKEKPETTTTTTATKTKLKIKAMQKRRASTDKFKRSNGNGNSKNVKIEDIEKLSPFPSPYPLPPGSPRPAPHPPTPLSTKPPSLPSLVFPNDFAIDEFFNGSSNSNEINMSNENGDRGGDGDGSPRTSSREWNGWSFMTWNPAREGGRESSDAGRESIDSRERLIQRSRSAMALRGYGLGIVGKGGTPWS